MMLERVGGLDSLNAWLKEAGYANTRMVQTTLDVFRQMLAPHDPAFATLTAEDVFAYWTTPNVISPHWSALQNARGAELQKRRRSEQSWRRSCRCWTTTTRISGSGA